MKAEAKHVGIPPSAPPNFVLALGAADAAQALGISVRSLRRGVTAGRIPGPLTIGGRRVWATETLRQWIAAGAPVVRREVDPVGGSP